MQEHYPEADICFWAEDACTDLHPVNSILNSGQPLEDTRANCCRGLIDRPGLLGGLTKSTDGRMLQLKWADLTGFDITRTYQEYLICSRSDGQILSTGQKLET